MLRQVLCAVLIATSLTPAQQVSTASPITDNAELTAMFKTDQTERQGPKVDWAALYKHDEERRRQVHQLLASGKIQSGVDYFHAALIFQHGSTPDDYLLAHVLAVSAIAKGNKSARWLSAATLDRYLRSIWQPQIYGTQFSKKENDAWHEDALNKNILSDSIRTAMCVQTLAQQQDTSARAGTSDNFAGTSVKDCP